MWYKSKILRYDVYRTCEITKLNFWEVEILLKNNTHSQIRLWKKRNWKFTPWNFLESRRLKKNLDTKNLLFD